MNFVAHVLMTERSFFLQQHEGVKSRLCIPAWLTRILRLQKMIFCHFCTPGVEHLFCTQGCVSSRFKRVLELYRDLCVGKKHLMLFEQE